MMGTFKNILISLASGIVIRWGQKLLESDCLDLFLAESLLSIIITVLAINVTTSCLIVSRIQSLADIYTKGDTTSFKNTQHALYMAIIEQIILVFLTMLVLAVTNSKLSCIAQCAMLKEAAKVSLGAIFVFDLTIILDTAKGAFQITCFKPKN